MAIYESLKESFEILMKAVGPAIAISVVLGGLVFLVLLLAQRKLPGHLLISLFAIAAVGASAGFSGGMSRAPAVGQIVPAILGIIGAASVYFLRFASEENVAVSVAAATLAIAMLAGFGLGADQRKGIEDMHQLREACVAAYSDGELLAHDIAFARFSAHLGAHCGPFMVWDKRNLTPKNASQDK